MKKLIFVLFTILCNEGILAESGFPWPGKEDGM